MATWPRSCSRAASRSGGSRRRLPGPLGPAPGMGDMRVTSSLLPGAARWLTR